MGTIIERKRKDGTTGYTAQIVRKQKGEIVWRQAQTFDRKSAAKAWLSKRETELAAPGAIALANAPRTTLSAAIDRYIDESKAAIGRTKTQVLRSIKLYEFAAMDCADIRSEHIVQFANELSTGDRKPQTVGNYLSHLAAIFAIAKPAWNYPLDQNAMKDAHTVLRRLGTTSKSANRDRRPTLEELDRIMQYFFDRSARAPNAAKMHKVIAFAVYSTRRQEEIARQSWADLDIRGSRLMVRDMKHPGQKQGNDVWCDLPPEAVQIAESMPRSALEIFPYSTDAISAAFTRACKFLEINDLHFHDLRHEGISRLFEMGKTIPQAASVSGHRSWQSLQRYAHLREAGDKYASWKWLALVTSHDAS